MKCKLIIGVLLFIGLGSALAEARTITVARDGTGEYTVLQNALNAAASGDSLLLGPGEYAEMTSVKYPGYPWPVDVVGDIRASELTLIGAGPGQTFIGQATQNIDINHYTPNALIWNGGSFFRLENVTIRNSFNGLDSSSGGPLFVNNCVFMDNVRALSWKNIGSGGYVGNSTFSTNYVSYNAQLDIWGSGGGAVIEDCDIGSSLADMSMQVVYVDNILVRNCEMHGGQLGMQIGGGASCILDNCRIYDASMTGVNVTPVGAQVEIRDSEVSGGQLAVSVHEEGLFTATNSIFTGGSLGVIKFFCASPSTVHYCHLINGGSSYSVECGRIPECGSVRHDFRGNYWGTEDGNQIASFIYDGHDDPSLRAEVLYTPFATGSTDLVVGLAPADSQIVIPDTGGTFLYNATLENNSQAAITADLAIEAVLPDGTAYPVLNLPGQTIPAASVLKRNGLSQTVPPGAPAGTYSYRVTASLGDTLLVDSDEFPFTKQGVVAAAARNTDWSLRGWVRDEDIPRAENAPGLILHPATPNPFNPTTTLAFELPSQEAVSLRVFDLQGRLIRTLLSGETLAQGRHEAVWDGRDGAGRRVSSGTYFYRIEAGVFSQTRRAVLVK